MSAEHDPFAAFRADTRARIGLGRAGSALPTAALLDLQEAHAKARDAIFQETDWERLARELSPLSTLLVQSQADSRQTYLRRPDLGRRLALEYHQTLAQQGGPFDLAVVVADGLSGRAVEQGAVELVRELRQSLVDLSFAPLILAKQARVALGDEIGALLGARLVVVLIGERPGLSVADSLGLYLTWKPQLGRTDAERNCISNIHESGLSARDAARLLSWLVRAAEQRQLTGVELKPEQLPALAPRAVASAVAALPGPSAESALDAGEEER